MCFLAARRMYHYIPHGGIDIGELGLLGHAQQLLDSQPNDVSFVIHDLPLISKLGDIEKAIGNKFGLLEGRCPEISGGFRN